MLSKNQNTNSEPLFLRASGLGLNVIDILDPSLASAKILDISNNSIKNLQNIEQFKDLEVLQISNNLISFIEDLRPLTLLKNLTQLGIEGNPVCSFPIFKIYLLFLCNSLQEIDGKSVDSIIYKKKFTKNELKTILAAEESLLNSALICEFATKFISKKPSLIKGRTVEFILQGVLTSDFRKQKYSLIRKQFSGNGINRYINNLKKLVMHRHQSISESLSKRNRFPKNIIQDYLTTIQNITNVIELVELSHGIKRLNQILHQCLKIHQAEDDRSMLEVIIKQDDFNDMSDFLEDSVYNVNQPSEVQQVNPSNQQAPIDSQEFQEMKDEIQRLSKEQIEHNKMIAEMKEAHNKEINKIKQDYEQKLKDNNDSIRCLKYELKQVISNQRIVSNNKVIAIPTPPTSELLPTRIIHILQQGENDSNNSNWRETPIDDYQLRSLEKTILNHQCKEIKKLNICDQNHQLLHDEINKLKNQVVLLSAEIAPYKASIEALENVKNSSVIKENDYLEMKQGLNELRERIEKTNLPTNNVEYIIQKRLLDDMKTSFENEIKANNDKINTKFDEMSTKMKYDIEGVRKDIQENANIHQILQNTEEQNQKLRTEMQMAEKQMKDFRDYLEKYSNTEKIDELKEIYKKRYNELLLNIEEMKTTSNAAIESIQDQVNKINQGSASQSISPEQLNQIKDMFESRLTDFNTQIDQITKCKTTIDCLKHEMKKFKLSQKEVVCQEIEKNLRAQKEYIEYMKDAYQNELDKVNNKIIEITKEHEESMKTVNTKIKKLKAAKSSKSKE